MIDEKPQVQNAADRGQVKEAGKRAREIERQHLADLRAIMQLPEGRRVLWWFLEFAGPFRSCFDNSGSVTSFNLGKDAVGKFLLVQLQKADIEKFFEMLRDAKHELEEK